MNEMDVKMSMEVKRQKELEKNSSFLFMEMSCKNPRPICVKSANSLPMICMR